MASRTGDAPERSTLLLKARCRDVFTHLPKALAGEEEPIHDVRVASRRLTMALPLLGRKPKGRRVKRALGLLKSLTRAAGGSRDIDVGLALLEGRIKEAPSPAGRSLRQRYRAARKRGRSKMAEDLLDLDIALLRRDLRGILARKGEGLFTALRRAQTMREQYGVRVLASLDGIADRFDPEALHDVRILCRRLRYCSEVLDDLRGGRSHAPKLLRALQGHLGQIHDAWVLATWLSGAALRAEARGNLVLATEARRLEAAFIADCRSHHAAFLDAQPGRTVRHALGIEELPAFSSDPGQTA